MRISLRGRLILWSILTIPALIFGLVFTAQHIMVTNMRGDIEGDLRDNANFIAKAIISSNGNSQQSYANVISGVFNQLPSIPLLVRLSDAKGNILVTFGEIPSSMVPRLDRQLQRSDIGQGKFHTIKAKGERSLRVYTVPVPDPTTGERRFLIQIGNSLAQVTAAEHRLWRYTLTVGIGGSLIALFVGWLILRQGLRPLDRILLRVREIETSDLQAGIPDEPRPPELQKLASSLNAMWQRLETAFQERETFVASVSHDLRTPLTALQGQIEVLLMRPTLDSEIRDSLERMAREARRLARMTSNLLLNAQLESKAAYVAEPVNLRELLDEVVGDVWVMAEGLDFTVLAPRDVIVRGDHDLLKQMVLNVVDNAIKFTPKEGQVNIVLSQEQGWATIQVSDTGPGIPAEALPYVTEPFYKRATGNRGAGLGLAIVKQVIERHGGQLEITNREGGGTTVAVRLPVWSGTS